MPRTLAVGILLASLLSASPSGAVTPTLLRDINQVARPINVSSTGAVVGTLRGPRFFTYVSTPETGFELGIINLSNGALDIVDLEPGPTSSFRFAQNFLPLGRLLVFTAHTVEHGQELWVSDGTPEGTMMLADIRPGPDGSFPRDLVDVGNDVAFFAADDGTHGVELWGTNGEPASTLLFADINSGEGSSNPSHIIVGPNGFLMSACDHNPPVTPGCEPYFLHPFVSAGFLDVVASPFQSAPREFIRLANPAQAVFSGNVGNNNDAELWITDGATVGGTVVVKDIVPGGVGSFPQNFRLVNGVVVFDAETPENGRELWRTDGTTGGTVLIADVFPGAHEGLAFNAPRAVVGGTGLVYPATFEDAGAELAVTDGFTVTRLADTMPGPLAGVLPNSLSRSIARVLAATAGKAYAVLADLAHGSELWETDGTPGGTTLVADLLPGPSSSQPILVATRDETVFFLAQGPGGFGLWRRDVGEPSLVRDFSAGGTDTAFLGIAPVAMGGRLFFSAFDSEAGRELWTTDGTPGGTARLADLHPGFGGSDSQFLRMMVMGDRVFFVATDGVHGLELFVSDGTALGTRMLVDIVAGDGSSNPNLQAVLGGRLLFSARTPGEGFELWASDGTPEGTQLLKDIAPGDLSASPSRIVASGSRAFFSAPNLWVTDGTPEGTTPVDDELFVLGNDRSPLPFGEGSVLFQGVTSMNPDDPELWISDGTAAGSRMVKDLVPGTDAGGEPRFLTGAGSRAFFVAATSDGVGLWVTDGTEPGTTLVKAPIAPSEDEANTFEMVAIGERVVFTLAANAGRSLWVSDGTPAGTLQVSGLCPAEQSCGPSALFAYETVAFFNFDDGMHGLELWQSDGTPAGTVMVADVVPGTAPFTVERGKFGVLDGKVFFSGCEDTHGCEPWILDFDQCPSDTAKLAPGACGCDLADLDADASGVADCLLGSELRARLDALRALIEAVAKPKSKAERRAFKEKIAAIIAAFDAAAGYRDANAGVFPGLEKPFKKVKKAIKRLRQKRGAKGPRTKALAAVAAVRAAVVGP